MITLSAGVKWTEGLVPYVSRSRKKSVEVRCERQLWWSDMFSCTIGLLGKAPGLEHGIDKLPR